MRPRLLLAAMAVAAMVATVDASMQIHVTCPRNVTSDPAHTRTLTAELARALESVSAPAGYTLDVALSGVTAEPAGREIAVRVETRAALSDARGYVKWVSTARATAQGSLRDRSLVERDAFTAVAAELARQVRAHSR